MKVYKLRNDTTGFLGLTAVEPDDSKLLVEVGRGESLRMRWRPIPVMVAREYLEREDLVLGDLASTFPSRPILSGRAVDRLKPMLERSGELLPLISSLGEFHVFNPLPMRDALDFDSSRIERLSSGAIWDTSDNRYCFLPSVIGDAAIFLVPQLRGTIFVTDEFVQEVSSHGLQGFRFPLAWDGYLS